MFLLLLISIAAASLNSTVLHKAKLTKKGSIYLFNLFGMAVWCICLFLANGGRLHLNESVLLCGCIYGITQALFILFKTAAMNSGPVSITTLIGNCSLLISVVVCFVLWHEPISPADIGGLTLLMLGIVLTTLKTTDGKFTKKWLFYASFFLVLGAGVGIIFKAFSKTGTAYAGDMMLVASVVMLITYTVFCVFTKGFTSISKETTKNERRTFILTALVSGLLSCLYNRLNISLSGALDGVIFFPTFNGGVVVLSTVLSVLILKEKLTVKQIVGISIGVLGICIIGIL